MAVGCGSDGCAVAERELAEHRAWPHPQYPGLAWRCGRMQLASGRRAGGWRWAEEAGVRVCVMTVQARNGCARRG